MVILNLYNMVGECIDLKLKNKETARGFTIFMLGERKRHLDDIEMIDKVLKAVSKKWGFVISLNKTHMSLDGEEIKDIWVGVEDI